MNEHDGPTALCNSLPFRHGFERLPYVDHSRARRFTGLSKRRNRRCKLSFRKSRRQKVRKQRRRKKKETAPTRAAKTTAGGKNDKMMMTMNNNNNNNNFGNVGLIMSAPTGSIETEEMRKAERESCILCSNIIKTRCICFTRNSKWLRSSSISSPNVKLARCTRRRSRTVSNLAAHMGVMGAMPPMQPFGFPPPHGQHNPFMMFPMQSFPPQSEYVNNFFQGLASTVAT